MTSLYNFNVFRSAAQLSYTQPTARIPKWSSRRPESMRRHLTAYFTRTGTARIRNLCRLRRRGKRSHSLGQTKSRGKLNSLFSFFLPPDSTSHHTPATTRTIGTSWGQPRRRQAVAAAGPAMVTGAAAANSTPTAKCLELAVCPGKGRLCFAFYTNGFKYRARELRPTHCCTFYFVFIRRTFTNEQRSQTSGPLLD